MTETSGEKSVMAQIIEAWFAELAETDEFDDRDIERLRELAAEEALGRRGQVLKILKGNPG
jgi:hypothetical protein